MPNRSVRNLVLFFVWIGIVGVAIVAYLLLFSGREPQTAEGPEQKGAETNNGEPEPTPTEVMSMAVSARALALEVASLIVVSLTTITW